MADTWTLSFTDANGRVGTKTYDNETAFISGVLDKLTDLRTSNVLAVLPDGTKLDEQALRDRFMLYGQVHEMGRAMPTIDLPDDELAAITAAIRRAIEDDEYPHAPGSFRCSRRCGSSRRRQPRSQSRLPKAPPPAKADKRARR
jgi:hypothetical protein